MHAHNSLESLENTAFNPFPHFRVVFQSKPKKKTGLSTSYDSLQGPLKGIKILHSLHPYRSHELSLHCWCFQTFHQQPGLTLVSHCSPFLANSALSLTALPWDKLCQSAAHTEPVWSCSSCHNNNAQPLASPAEHIQSQGTPLLQAWSLLAVRSVKVVTW